MANSVDRFLDVVRSFFEGDTRSVQIVAAIFATLLFFAYYSVKIYDFNQRNFVETHDVWTYAAWVINYSAGFVRRGLIGTVLSTFSTQENLPTHAAWLLTTAYILFAIAILSAYLWVKTDRFFWFVVLSFHPLGLSYYLAEPTAIGRGETLYFLELCCLVILFRFTQSSWPFLLFGAALGITIFIHEVFVFVIGPLWICLLYLVTTRHISLPTFFCVVATPLAAFTALILFSAHGPVAPTICSSLGTAAPPTCTTHSQIFFLDQGIGYALNNTWLTIRQPGFLQTYAIGVLLVVSGPIGYLIFCRSDPFRRRFVWVLIFASLTTFPLFMITNDWGRWQHMIFLSLMFSLLLLDTSKQPELHSRTELQSRPDLLLLALLVVGVVTVPTNAATLLPGPWVEVVRSVAYTTLEKLDGLRCRREPAPRFCEKPILSRTDW